MTLASFRQVLENLYYVSSETLSTSSKEIQTYNVLKSSGCGNTSPLFLHILQKCASDVVLGLLLGCNELGGALLSCHGSTSRLIYILTMIGCLSGMGVERGGRAGGGGGLFATAGCLKKPCMEMRDERRLLLTMTFSFFLLPKAWVEGTDSFFLFFIQSERWASMKTRRCSISWFPCIYLDVKDYIVCLRVVAEYDFHLLWNLQFLCKA